MIKVKKFLSVLAIIFLILSNGAFAEFDESSDSGAVSGSLGMISTENKEKEMTEDFSTEEPSEDEMRSMAKEKLDRDFSEEEFKRMTELKDRMSRKEAFSYEHEGFEHKFDAGPSYEGYSNEHKILGMLFDFIGDYVDPKEMEQHCNDPLKFADIVIAKLKEKVGDLQTLCDKFEEQESQCAEYAKRGCSQIGIPVVKEGATEAEKLQSVAYSCPVNKEAIINVCKVRGNAHLEQRIKFVAESCTKRFDFEGERLLKECKKFSENQNCDKERYINQCIGRFKSNDGGKTRFGNSNWFKYAKWECYDGYRESQGSETSCKPSETWSDYARKSCEGHCNEDKSRCGVNSFDVDGECAQASSTPVCPIPNIPQCKEDQTLQKKVDDKGCIDYYCRIIVNNPAICGNKICEEGEANDPGGCGPGSDPRCLGPPARMGTCPQDCEVSVKCTADVRQCPDGNFVSRVPPNCEFKQCQTQAACHEPAAPNCAAGSVLEKKNDEKGCVYYYCRKIECREVSKPSCGQDEELQVYYDNSGCVSSYQCLKQDIAWCPQVSKPTCNDGQSLTAKYDERKCIVGYECINTATTASVIGIIGNVILSNEDTLLRHCQNSWIEQERICSGISSTCDKNTFIEKCKEQEKKNNVDYALRYENDCESYTISEIKAAEHRCAKIQDERKGCIEENLRKCEQREGLSHQCKNSLNEEQLRNFIIGESNKRCRLVGISEDEEDVEKAEKAEIILAVLNTATKDDLGKLELFVDGLHEQLKLEETTVYKGITDHTMFADIKLLPFVVNAKLSAFQSSQHSEEVKTKIVAGQKTVEVASKLASLRNSGVPNEYIYIIEDKANDILNVSNNLEEIENKQKEKGIGYKFRLFFGLAKKAEQEEIRQLSESKEKLQNSIQTLAKLTDEVSSDIVKAVLKEQVENLIRQKEDIDTLIKSKEKKSKGLFGLFG